MGDYTLRAKLIADASNLEKNFARAQASLQAMSSKMSSLGSTVTSLGKTLMPATVAVSGIGVASAKTSIDFIKLYESTIIVFEKMLGGKDAANALYDSLLKTAKASTFSQETFLTCGKQLVGMGLSAQDTSKYMQAISDAVSAFGGTSTNIEQVAEAFSKISTAGKLSMEDVNQLANNGIQALKILGNAYGLTTEEMRGMISDGAVPAKEAMDKLADGIENGTDGVNGMTQALEGMSAAMKGKTLTGALDSLNTGFRSFSQNLTGMNPTLKETDEGFAESQQRIAQLTASVSTISGILPQLSKLFITVTDGIGGLLDKLVGANVAFDEASGKWQNVGGVLGSIQEKLDGLNTDQLKSIGDAIAGLAVAGPGLIVFGKGITTLGSAAASAKFAVGGLQKPISLFKDGLNGLDKEFPKLSKNMGNIRGAFGQFSSTIGSAITGAFPYVQNGVTNITGLFGTLGSNIASRIKGMQSSIGGAFSTVFGGIAGKIGGFLSPVTSVLKNAFAPIQATLFSSLGGIGSSIMAFAPSFLSAFSSAFSFLAIAGLIVAGFGLLQQNFGDQINGMLQTLVTQGPAMIQQFCASISNQIPGLITLGTRLIVSLLNAITAMLPSIVSGGAEILTKLVEGIAINLPFLIPAALNMIITLATSLLGNVGQIVDAGIRLLTGLVDGLIAAIPELIAAIPTIIKNLLTAIIQNMPKLIEAGINLTVALGIGLIQAIPELVGMLPEIFSAIFEAFGSINWIDLGKNIIKGIIEGLGAMLGALWDAVKEIGQSIMDWFKAPDALDVNSPSKRMRDEVGVMIPAGIGEGIKSGAALAVAPIKKITDQIALAGADANLDVPVQGKAVNVDLTANIGNPVKGIGTEIDSEWSQVSASTTTQWQAIQTFLKTTWTAIKSDASSDWAALQNMITSKWGAISNGTTNSWNTILSYLRKTWQSMLLESLSSWTGMRDGVQSVLGGLYGVVTSGFAPSLRYIQGLSNTLYGYGANMINELARGVRDTAGGVTGAIEDLVETLKSKFIEGFEIHSPSHFTYYVGTMLGKGLINSLRDSHLASFVDSMIAEMKNSFSQGKLNLSAVMSFMGDQAPDLLKELGITLGGGTGIMGAGGMVWPSDFTEITSWFGNRPYPGAGGSTNHGGLDIGASMGSNVYAALGGTITSSGWNGGYGNAITIDHGNGLSTLYGHMSQLIASVGQMVAPGQVIGLVGSTGNSTGPHLHFETRMNGERMDPASFFGFSVGSRDVPQDMIAWVHKHEAIIPADEMEKLKRLTNPRAPYRNSHGDILPGLNTRFANSAQGFSVNSWDETWTSQSKIQGSRRRVPDIKVEVTSVMDGRKVGYGSARYVNEKNTFDEKRRNRIGGIV